MLISRSKTILAVVLIVFLGLIAGYFYESGVDTNTFTMQDNVLLASIASDEGVSTPKNILFGNNNQFELGPSPFPEAMTGVYTSPDNIVWFQPLRSWIYAFDRETKTLTQLADVANLIVDIPVELNTVYENGDILFSERRRYPPEAHPYYLSFFGEGIEFYYKYDAQNTTLEEIDLLAGFDWQPLIEAGEKVGHFSLSPNGKFIAYSIGYNGVDPPRVALGSLTEHIGGFPTAIQDRFNSGELWATDSSVLWFYSNSYTPYVPNVETIGEVFAFSTTTGEVTQITDFTAYYSGETVNILRLSSSPSGRYLAFWVASSNQSGSALDTLYLYDQKNAILQIIFERQIQEDYRSWSAMLWQPDENAVAFTLNTNKDLIEDQLIVVPINQPEPLIYDLSSYNIRKISEWLE